MLVSVPDPKLTPVRIAFSIALYWKRYTCRMRSGDETMLMQVDYIMDLMPYANYSLLFLYLLQGCPVT